jgi:hypothetical protein
MSSLDILPESPTSKTQGDITEDVEDTTAGNARVEVTEEEVPASFTRYRTRLVSDCTFDFF